MAKYCKNCGAELHIGDKFCRQCGTDNSVETTSAFSAAQSVSAISDTENVNVRTKRAKQSHVRHSLFGFRFGKTWKKVIAIVWYVVSIFALITSLSTEPSFSCSERGLMFYRAYLTAFCAPLILVPLVCSDFKIYRKLPGKYLGNISRSVIAIIICFVLSFVFFNNLSPEYKTANDAYKAQQNAAESVQSEQATTESDTGEEADDSAEAEQSASETENPISELAEALIANDYTEEEARAFCDVVVNCGLTKYVSGSTIEAYNNGALTSVRIRKESSWGVLQINATAENHEVFYVDWNRKRYGLTKDHGDTVIMYDTDNVDGGYKNYYDEESDAFMAWELRPNA